MVLGKPASAGFFSSAENGFLWQLPKAAFGCAAAVDPTHTMYLKDRSILRLLRSRTQPSAAATKAGFRVLSGQWLTRSRWYVVF
jgi:hypothetical protein